MKTELMDDGQGGQLLMFHCPGCEMGHGPRVVGARPGALWTWNGDREKPTLQPSVLVRGTQRITDDEHARIMRGESVAPRPLVCHSFVRDGQIQFLNDSTHHLAGQTVDLPDMD